MPLSSLSSQKVQHYSICTSQLLVFKCSLKIPENAWNERTIRQCYHRRATLADTPKKNLNHFLINGPFLPSHRNLTSFCRFFRQCFCHMQLLLPGLGMNYLEWQPHKNQLTFVFNATGIAIMGKISPEAHIQMLSPKNISCRNFPREGKKLKILQQMMSLSRFTSEMFPKHHDTRD